MIGPRSQDRFEPWPWILATMLAAMIATSLGFYAIAASHPDPEVDRSELRSTAASLPLAESESGAKPSSASPRWEP